MGNLTFRPKRYPFATCVLIAVAITIGLAIMKEPLYAVLDLAEKGAFTGLFATLAGFLITGLTILLALSNDNSLAKISATKAYGYIHEAFIRSIWAQVIALLLSLVGQITTFTNDIVRGIFAHIYVLSVLIAASTLVCSIYCLSLIVKKVVSDKRAQWENDGD